MPDDVTLLSGPLPEPGTVRIVVTLVQADGSIRHVDTTPTTDELERLSPNQIVERYMKPATFALLGR